MIHEIGKWVYVTAGWLLLSLGVGLGGYGGWLLTHLADPIDETGLRAELTNTCKALAGDAGYLITHKGSRLAFRENGIDGFESRLQRAALVTQGCEGYVLDAFCMGEGCSGDHTPGGVSFMLEYTDAARRTEN